MLTLPARVFAPGQWRGRGGPVAPPESWSGRRLHAVRREALMAERLFLIVAIVFGLVVPIAVMVALVYM